MSGYGHGRWCPFNANAWRGKYVCLAVFAPWLPWDVNQPISHDISSTSPPCPGQDTFWIFVAIIERYLEHLYSPGLEQLIIDAKVFEKLLPSVTRKVSQHLVWCSEMSFSWTPRWIFFNAIPSPIAPHRKNMKSIHCLWLRRGSWHYFPPLYPGLLFFAYGTCFYVKVGSWSPTLFPPPSPFSSRQIHAPHVGIKPMFRMALAIM